MQNENRLVPDFRAETVEEITESYTPENGAEQTATYKIGTAHPIIGGILDKFTWIRTHAAAVWWNALERVTLRDKITSMDGEIAQLNGKKFYKTSKRFESVMANTTLVLFNLSDLGITSQNVLILTTISAGGIMAMDNGIIFCNKDANTINYMTLTSQNSFTVIWGMIYEK